MCEENRAEQLPRDIGGEALFLNLMAVAPPSIQFADDDLRHSHDLTRIRNALYGLGATALLGGLVAGHPCSTKATRSTRLNNCARKPPWPPGVTGNRQDVPADTNQQRNALDGSSTTYVELEKRSTSPNGLYGEISRALQATPTIELDEIDWLTGGTDPGTKPGNAAQPATAAIPADSEAAIVRGAIRLGNNANPRQMLAVFDQFIAALKPTPICRSPSRSGRSTSSPARRSRTRTPASKTGNHAPSPPDHPEESDHEICPG